MSKASLTRAKRAVRFVLAERGKNQAWLAHRAGCTPAYLSRVLSGYQPPSQDFIAKVERLTGVNLLDPPDVRIAPADSTVAQ